MQRILEPEELAKLIQDVRQSYQQANMYCKVVMTSGPYTILHEGHVKCFKEATKFGNIWIAVVNGDNFVKKKKGYVLVPAEQRAFVVSALKYVHYTTIWNGKNQYVDGAIKLIKPDVFCKGGDRTKENMCKEEIQACKEVGCEIKYGVGGFDKSNSISDIVQRIKENECV